MTPASPSNTGAMSAAITLYRLAIERDQPDAARPGAAARGEQSGVVVFQGDLAVRQLLSGGLAQGSGKVTKSHPTSLASRLENPWRRAVGHS